LLTAAQINGARVTVITHAAADYKLQEQPGAAALLKALTDASVRVIEKANAYQKFAVIDQSVVWYGNVSLLSYGTAEESIMRLEQKEIAEELLGMAH
jgi:phosphatidylserine/phosphatidylglycerophosphate/cardiolipin synthase-like enzyme